MAQFVFAIIFWIIAIVMALMVFAESSEGYRIPLGGGAVLVAVLGVLLFGWGGIKSVPLRNIGEPVSFNQVGAHFYEPGTYWTWEPWMSLVNVDETVQTTTFESGGAMTGTGSCNGLMPVRIGGNFQACAKITIQWQINPPAAGGLLQDYANKGPLMPEITNAVVVRELEQVVNNVVGDYSPITDTTSVNTNSGQQSQFTGFSATILRDMQADIGSRIKVLSILFPNMQYPDSVEKQLQAIQQAAANLVIAKENVLVNQQNAAAFAKLGTPSVPQLIAQCLTDVKSEANLPAGFSCFPGSGSGLALSSK